MSELNGHHKAMHALPTHVTREELLAVAKALGDTFKDREKVLLQKLGDRLDKEPRSVTVSAQPTDTSLVTLALNSLVQKAVDQVKVIEEGNAIMPSMVKELVQGIAAALGQVQFTATVEPQVSAPEVHLTNEVAVPQVFNQVDVPPAQVQVAVDLSRLEDLLGRQEQALAQHSKVMLAVIQEMKLFRKRKTKTIVHRDVSGDIEYTSTEEVI